MLQELRYKHLIQNVIFIMKLFCTASILLLEVDIGIFTFDFDIQYKDSYSIFIIPYRDWYYIFIILYATTLLYGRKHFWIVKNVDFIIFLAKRAATNYVFYHFLISSSSTSHCHHGFVYYSNLEDMYNYVYQHLLNNHESLFPEI